MAEVIWSGVPTSPIPDPFITTETAPMMARCIQLHQKFQLYKKDIPKSVEKCEQLYLRGLWSVGRQYWRRRREADTTSGMKALSRWFKAQCNYLVDHIEHQLHMDFMSFHVIQNTEEHPSMSDEQMMQLLDFRDEEGHGQCVATAWWLRKLGVTSQCQVTGNIIDIWLTVLNDFVSSGSGALALVLR